MLQKKKQPQHKAALVSACILLHLKKVWAQILCTALFWGNMFKGRYIQEKCSASCPDCMNWAGDVSGDACRVLALILSLSLCKPLHPKLCMAWDLHPAFLQKVSDSFQAQVRVPRIPAFVSDKASSSYKSYWGKCGSKEAGRKKPNLSYLPFMWFCNPYIMVLRAVLRFSLICSKKAPILEQDSQIWSRAFLSSVVSLKGPQTAQPICTNEIAFESPML